MSAVRVVLIGAAVVVALVGGVFLGWKGIGTFFPDAAVETVTETRSSQVIHSVNRQEQVVLLSLGIQGVEKIDSHGKIGDWVIPGSEVKAFLPYEFMAHLGIDGGDVTIEQRGENHFVITIPKFTMIGHDSVRLDELIVTGGVLKGTAKEINQSEITNRILSDEHKEEYVSKHEDILKSQANRFYSRIVTGIDPLATVEFEYLQSEG